MLTAQPIGRPPQGVAPVGQQAAALDQIIRWYCDPRAGQVFKLFGYAGTGKTTLAQHVIAALGLQGRALYAAYSGKAAHVLRRKGCDGASTIHSLIYVPLERSRDKLDRLIAMYKEAESDEEAAEIAAAIKREQRDLARPVFEKRSESDLQNAPLLILDEVSMVNAEIAGDLMSFGTRILCLGDPEQLPPVEGGGYFVNGQPDAMLTEIHRSAADSPVTRIATAVRQAADGDRRLGIYGPDGHSGRYPQPGDLLAYDQVICGTNATRWALIHRLRSLQGRTSPEPEPGDRIMTLANSTEAQVLNGQQFTVLTCNPLPEHTAKLSLVVADEDGVERDLTAWRSGFYNKAGEDLVKARGRGDTAAATFAHAITCHKSQGSQWDRVLVVDESHAFRAMTYKTRLAEVGETKAAAEAHRMARRWLYTAVTRAAEQAVIVNKGAM